LCKADKDMEPRSAICY